MANRAAELDLEARVAAAGNAMRSTLHTTARYAALPLRWVIPAGAVPGSSRCWASTTVEGAGPELELEPVELTCLLPADHEGPCGWAHVELLEPELGDRDRGPWWVAAGGYPTGEPTAMPTLLER